MAAPFATLQRGQHVAVAGDTVCIRGGTYGIIDTAPSGAGITLTKSGTSDTNRIKYLGVPGRGAGLRLLGLLISTTGYTIGFS